MTLFAVTLVPALRTELPFLVEVLFWLYVPISFICVAVYAAKEIRAGRLVSSGNSPAPWVVTRLSAWLFILCVLLLLFIQNAFYMVLVVLGVAALLAENRRSAREQFGLGRLPAAKLVRWSLLVCGAVILIEAPLTEAVQAAMTALHVPHPEQESVVTFRQFDRPGQIFDFMIQAVLLSPLIEELFFRGFLLTFLKNYTSTWLALVLSAGIFAFAHANLGSAAQLWVLGVVLGVAYEHTGSLLLPMGIHACWNLITALSLLLEKGGG